MRLPFLLLTVFAAFAGLAQGPCDSLATISAHQQKELTRQRLELDRVILDVEEARFQVAKARKEAEVLRGIMLGHINTIDSLQRENMRLQEAVKR
jgi:hypothetical protein